MYIKNVLITEFKHLLSMRAVQTTVVGVMRHSKVKNRAPTLWQEGCTIMEETDLFTYLLLEYPTKYHHQVKSEFDAQISKWKPSVSLLVYASPLQVQQD